MRALRIPQSESEALPLALSLAHSAPMFRTETEGRTLAYTAIFPDLSLPVDLVERLIGAAAELQDVQVSIDERPVESLAKFLSVLRCYRESLTDLDPPGPLRASGREDRRCVELPRSRLRLPMPVPLYALLASRSGDRCLTGSRSSKDDCDTSRSGVVPESQNAMRDEK